MLITAASALGGVPPCALYFGYGVLQNTSKDLISPPQCPGASTWRGGVTMNDAYVHDKSTRPFPQKCSTEYAWVLHYFWHIKTCIYLLMWDPHEQASFTGQIGTKNASLHSTTEASHEEQHLLRKFLPPNLPHVTSYYFWLPFLTKNNMWQSDQAADLTARSHHTAG
jgi:hypothetical protein